MAPAVDAARTSGTTVSSCFATALTPPAFAPLHENTTAVADAGGEWQCPQPQ
ncbi:hypothetical protein J7E24_16730 [Hymenobacter sp. ISL-91]|uniref:hypothetical protein n=1 Tax=Hymenobacter sp. ISL-91 TaxID=2819151 RepID=UPI001BECFD5C|nr:hypothetical protein [Hymenobacter sp. ISL-91]MBT2559434.1 hypothetical protein [Hymenobacter sp. ISL-91]